MTSPTFTNAMAMAACLSLTVSLAACNQPNGGRLPGVTADQAAECRARSEEVYKQQNRADIYQSDIYATSTRDSPFSTNGLPGITSQGLGAQYGRERALDNCYKASAGAPAAPSPKAAP